MAYGVTPTGFVAKTVQEVLADLRAEELARISEVLNTETSEPIGQLNAIYAEALGLVWEHAQAVYAAGTRNGASGFALDLIGALTGTLRRGATKSLVELTVNLNAGASCPIGSIVAEDGDASVRFVTLATVTNGGGVPANFTVQAEAETAGAVTANAGTLTVIVTPAAGWNSVTNLEDTSTGQIAEPDATYRQRQVFELPALGCATVDDLRAVLSQMTGMESVTVIENTTDAVVDSVPAHGIEAVIYDGAVPAIADNDVAQVIWDNKAMGAATGGTDSGTATDTEGGTHTMNFSRATSLNIYLEIDVAVDASAFASNGATLIAEAVAAWGDANLVVGDDVILSQLFASIFSVQGVTDVAEIRVGTAPSPVQTTNYITTPRQIADLDTGRIVVTVV